VVGELSIRELLQQQLIARCAIRKRGFYMGRRTFSPEQIINKLREAEILLSQGSRVNKDGQKIVEEQGYIPLNI
jgi:hypothetical protein